MRTKIFWPVLVSALGCVAISVPAEAQLVQIGEGSVVEKVAQLRPGEFVWAPQVAPSGPLLLIVNTTTQRATLFRNGVPIGASTVSTGRTGHETPTGVFTVLQKQVEHYSSKYDNAPMPYMQRLTWGGVALHAGRLPGHPASHGCIRLPAEFAKLLYGVTGLGMTVVVTEAPTVPRIAPTPEIVAQAAEPLVNERASAEWNPAKSPAGPLSIVVSIADGGAVVLRNGVVIGSAPVKVSGPVTGTFAYALRATDGQGQHWIRIALAGDAGEPQVPATEWQRFEAPDWFRNAVRAIIAPGTTIVVTPDSLRSGGVAAPIRVIQSETARKG